MYPCQLCRANRHACIYGHGSPPCDMCIRKGKACWSEICTARASLPGVLMDLQSLDLSGRVEKGPLALAGGTYSDVDFGELTSEDGTNLNMLVVIKQLRPKILPPKVLEKCIASELTIWSRTSHPNVLPLLGYSLDFGPYPAFITEWMPEGTLSDYVKNHPTVHKLFLVCGVARGLKYLHGKWIVHSDLKCCNIVVSDSGVPMLMDFGLSRQLDCSRKILTTRETTGTCRWMAMEFFDAGTDAPVAPIATFESDVWSFGMTVLEIISKEVPYRQYQHDTQAMFAIAKGELPRAPKLQTTCDQEMWELCKTCWTKKDARPSMTTVLDLLSSNSLQLTIVIGN
ncbi:kinase-like protein [Rickenella mellea]|uniref:Kinase-like protein n=1 Tax=Rickenella mellea TaxID=50990 RepID=A0A4Y7PPW8_9AGAM|nr:kinase-like protein [Rickenella mellea]